MPDVAPPPAPREPSRPRVRADGGPLPPPLGSLAPAPADLPPAPPTVPSSPPPTYEEVLAENRLVAAAQFARSASLEAAAAPSEAAGASGGGEAKVSPPPTAPRSSTVTVGRGGALQIQHKSSKELYRAVAAQWGLTCKMSDKCRCYDCQGRYFDFGEQNENDKGDGGLSATTPMFISEVMGGSACTLL